MALPIQAEPVPVQISEEGVAYVAGTRVTLDSLVYAFRRGSTPEQIAEAFDALSLAETYAVIAYYLRHRDEIDVYLEEEETASQRLRQHLEAEFGSAELRAKLLARKTQRN